MKWKLALRAAAIGVLTSVAVIISGVLFVFFVAPQWSNYGFEEYIIILILIVLFPVSAYAYAKAYSRKFSHAAAVYFLSLILLIFIIVFICLSLLLAIRTFCYFADCRTFPL